MKCPRHHLAMGPDGRCVLCRRDNPSGSSIPAPKLSARSLFGFGLGLVLLVTAAGAAIVWSRRKDALIASRVPVISFRRADTSAAPTPGGAESPAKKLPPAIGDLLAEKSAAAPDEPVDAPAPEQADASTDAAEAAETDAAGVADSGVQIGPTPDQIRDAIRRVQVTVYTTNKCPDCVKAQALLAANQIQFVERNIETNQEYRGQLFAMNPSGTVPTFLVDGHVVVGFDQAVLARSIGTRVEKQLGIKLDVRVPTSQH
jgi:glutaredoxin